MYALVYGVFKLLSWLPLRILYVLADFLAWLAGDVVKYRRRVVEENISSAFPDRDEKWVRETSRKFYRFLGDYFVETVRLLSMPAQEMGRRMVFENVEAVESLLEEGKDVSVYLGHYCNWEWVSSLPLHLVGEGIAAQIYHPLENKAMNKVFLRLRGRFGAHSIPMNSTLRTLLGWRREGKTSVTGYIADQAPGYNGIHLFVDFLHHDTPVFTGAERITRMFACAAYYCHIERPRRGYYRCRFVKLCEDASQLEPFELTRRYYKCLEEQICQAPQYWLWSHRRWKRTREGFMAWHGEDAEKLLSRL